MEIASVISSDFGYVEKLGEGLHAEVIRSRSRLFGEVALKVFKSKDSYQSELAHYRALPEDSRWPVCYGVSEEGRKPALALSVEEFVPLYVDTVHGRCVVAPGLGAADVLDAVIRVLRALGDMHDATARVHRDMHYKNFGLGYSAQSGGAIAFVFDFGLSEEGRNKEDFRFDVESVLRFTRMLIQANARGEGGEWNVLWLSLSRARGVCGRRGGGAFGSGYLAHAVAQWLESDGAALLCESDLDEYVRERLVGSAGLGERIRGKISGICELLHVPGMES